MNLLNLLKPVFVLLYLSAIATFAFVCGAIYIGCPIDKLLVLTSALIVFSVYAINRFTDREDLINDINKRLFFDNNPIILFLSILSLCLSVVTLLLFDRLTIFHIMIIFSGLAYSYKIIPILEKDKKIKFLRIKDIIFAKSIIVSLIWGASFFTISWSIYPNYIKNPIEIVLFIIGCSIATFVNTNFADIRDYKGDLTFNIPTLPVRFGIKNTYLYAMFIPSAIWLTTIITLNIMGIIGLQSLLFLLINLFFPLIYIFGYLKKIISNKLIEPCADAYIGVYAIGLLALSFIPKINF